MGQNPSAHAVRAGCGRPRGCTGEEPRKFRVGAKPDSECGAPVGGLLRRDVAGARPGRGARRGTKGDGFPQPSSQHKPGGTGEAGEEMPVPPGRLERRRCRGERCLPRDEPGRSAADAGLLSGCCGRGAVLNQPPAGRDRAAAGAAAAPGRPGPGGRPGGAAQPGTPGAQDEAKSGDTGGAARAGRGGCGGGKQLERGAGGNGGRAGAGGEGPPRGGMRGLGGSPSRLPAGRRRQRPGGPRARPGRGCGAPAGGGVP